MTVIDLKTEIKKALDEVPEDTLMDVLTYVNKLKFTPTGNNNLLTHLNQILSEDKELLEKLAQ